MGLHRTSFAIKYNNILLLYIHGYEQELHMISIIFSTHIKENV